MDSGHCTSSDWDCESHCKNELNLHKLCSRKIKAHKGEFKELCVENFDFGKDLCIPGQLTAANLVNCTKYAASTAYSVKTNYTLGTLLNFNAILDDPNSNLTSAPTIYTVPLSGYYSVTMQVDQQNLVPSSPLNPILGAPTANPQILVNGIVHREVYSAYLTFSNQQKTTISGLIKLNKGDLVQAKYNVLAIDQTLGLIPVVGTIDILGNGTDEQSVFLIHMLSATCGPNPCGTPGSSGCPVM